METRAGVTGTTDAPDFLTFVQQTVAFLPDAVGLQHPTEGLYNLTSWETTVVANIRAVLQDAENRALNRPWHTYLLGLIHAVLGAESVVSKLVASHSFPSIYYGLLHDDRTYWNVYDRVRHEP